MTSKIDLNPPAYQPSEAEDQLALLEHFTDCDFFGMTYAFKRVYEIGESIAPHPNFEEYRARTVQRFLDDSQKFLDAVSEGGDWFKYTTAHWDDYTLKGSLSEIHCGDCVYISCTCDRCLAETYYGIPYTATWSGEEGSKAWHELHDKRSILEKWFDSVKDLFK